MQGVVFNIQRYSVQDGPGIRTTVFLKGCPLSCWWCHNPESQAARPQVVVIETRCARCGECRKVCPGEKEEGAAPHPALSPEYRGEGKSGNSAGNVSERCVRCGACVEACPTGARQMVGQEMSVADVMAAILKDRIFYDDSGGGATFSGGEPMMQFDFLMELLDRCRRHGVQTAVDTSGFAPQEKLLAAAKLTGLFLYDLKMIDDEKHRKYTGVSNSGIIDNLRALGEAHGNIWLRVPVIPGINDDEADAIAQLAASVRGIRQVNLLPYHQTGIGKSARLGEAYRLKDVRPPDADRMEELAAKFRARGLVTRIGG